MGDNLCGVGVRFQHHGAESRGLDGGYFTADILEGESFVSGGALGCGLVCWVGGEGEGVGGCLGESHFERVDDGVELVSEM